VNRHIQIGVLFVCAVLFALLPSSALAEDYIIDDFGGDCENLGGVWQSDYSSWHCAVSQWMLAEGDTLTILPGGVLRVGGTGNLNAGTIYNGGTMSVVDDGFVSSSSEISSTGMVSNTGVLDIGDREYGVGLVTNSGSIENGGEINIWSDIYSGEGSVINSSGVISNLTTGTIYVRSDMVVPYGCYADGTFENSGVVFNAGTISNYGVIRNRGSLANETNGVIELLLFSRIDQLCRGAGISQSLLESSGFLSNAGTIYSLGGTLRNVGHFDNAGAFSNTVEFIVYETMCSPEPIIYYLGTVDNMSMINNTGTITLCNVDWSGNAPDGNLVVYERCRASFPVIHKNP
jgi:hypothetical protein